MSTARGSAVAATLSQAHYGLTAVARRDALAALAGSDGIASMMGPVRRADLAARSAQARLELHAPAVEMSTP
jgi:hypothetical protein